MQVIPDSVLPRTSSSSRTTTVPAAKKILTNSRLKKRNLLLRLRTRMMCIPSWRTRLRQIFTDISISRRAYFCNYLAVSRRRRKRTSSSVVTSTSVLSVTLQQPNRSSSSTYASSCLELSTRVVKHQVQLVSRQVSSRTRRQVTSVSRPVRSCSPTTAYAASMSSTKWK